MSPNLCPSSRSVAGRVALSGRERVSLRFVREMFSHAGGVMSYNVCIDHTSAARPASCHARRRRARAGAT